MHYNGFFLEKPIGNNAFSYEKRKNKKLYIPELMEIEDFSNIKLQDDKEKIAFEDFGFDSKLSTNYGLKNFYKINPLTPLSGEITAPIYLLDNHNHAFYFWYLARSEGIIGDDNILIHIDEHADTRDNSKHLLKPDSEDLQKVFEFTNKVLNVGDYIIPAQKEGIIGDIIQIRNETNLLDYLENRGQPLGLPLQNECRDTPCGYPDKNIILNLDLDFFQSDLDFIDYDLKKKVILNAAKTAKVITVATSPFFINQDLAIKVFKDLFS